MKLFSILSAAFLCAQVCVASTTGGEEVRTLACVPAFGQTFVGIQYALEVVTQSLSPEYFVRRCELVKTIVTPGFPQQRIVLAVDKQTKDYVRCSIGETTVDLNKKDSYSAKVYMSHELAYTCE